MFSGDTRADCDKPRGTAGLNPCELYGYCTPKKERNQSYCMAAGPDACKNAVMCGDWCTYRDGYCHKEGSPRLWDSYFEGIQSGRKFMEQFGTRTRVAPLQPSRPATGQTPMDAGENPDG